MCRNMPFSQNLWCGEWPSFPAPGFSSHLCCTQQNHFSNQRLKGLFHAPFNQMSYWNSSLIPPPLCEGSWSSISTLPTLVHTIPAVSPKCYFYTPKIPRACICKKWPAGVPLKQENHPGKVCLSWHRLQEQVLPLSPPAGSALMSAAPHCSAGFCSQQEHMEEVLLLGTPETAIVCPSNNSTHKKSALIYKAILYTGL